MSTPWGLIRIIKALLSVMQWLEHAEFWAVQQYYLEEKSFAAFKNFCSLGESTNCDVLEILYELGLMFALVNKEGF